jgi:transposase
MAGIDLHSNNLFCGILDEDGKQVFLQKLPAKLKSVLHALKPYKSRLESVAVESTFNWYWLVDGLQDAGYNTLLANPARIEQYSGRKRTDDKSDALFLAELSRLNILPQGYICERGTRAVRDLLRRRLMLVQQRTALYISLKSLYTRTTGQRLPLTQVKSATLETAGEWHANPDNELAARVQLGVVEQLGTAIETIEKRVMKEVKRSKGFRMLQTVPGIGPILGMTIVLETVDIARFKTAGDFASYCRCVDTARSSNGKKKGRNNGKCGNQYLAWAFVEAAHGAARSCSRAGSFYDRKKRERNGTVATKALACKLAKACWHMLKEETAFDPEKCFGGKAEKPQRKSK